MLKKKRNSLSEEFVILYNSLLDYKLGFATQAPIALYMQCISYDDYYYEMIYRTIFKASIEQNVLYIPSEELNIGKKIDTMIDEYNSKIPEFQKNRRICPNCHAMLHSRLNGAYLTIDQLKEEMLKAKNTLVVGYNIKHPSYGVGTIKEVKNNDVIVYFASKGMMRISKEFVLNKCEILY